MTFSPEFIKKIEEMLRSDIAAKKAKRPPRDYIMDYIKYLQDMAPEKKEQFVNPDIIELMETEGFPSEELLKEVEEIYLLDPYELTTELDRFHRAEASFNIIVIKSHSAALKAIRKSMMDPIIRTDG